MQFTTSFVVVFLVFAKAPGIKADDHDDTENNDQEFYFSPRVDTKELVKSEIDARFENLTNVFNMKLTEIESRMEKPLKALADSFLNLNHSIHEIREKMAASELKNEMLISNILESLNGSLSKTIVELGVQIKTVEGKIQQNSSSCMNHSMAAVGNKTEVGSLFLSGVETKNDISSSTRTQPFLLQKRTIVEELIGDSGTIEFDGTEDFHIRRKIWVISTKGYEYFESVSFIMEENSLGSSARLTLSDVELTEHVFTGLTDEKEVEFSTATLLLVTLVVRNSSSSAEAPRFKLNFIVTRDTGDYYQTTEVMHKDGLQSVSYPMQNHKNYPLMGRYGAVIAPPNGNSFRLTMTYLDIPGTPPVCEDTSFNMWFLEESPTVTEFVEVPEAVRRCGNFGDVSEVVGNATVFILRFKPLSSAKEAGRGFRLEVDDST